MEGKMRVTHLWDDEYCLKCYKCGYNNIFKLKEMENKEGEKKDGQRTIL